MIIFLSVQYTVTLPYQECGYHLYNNYNKETSQLAGKAYEDSDYTLAIAVVHRLKRIIVQKLILVVEL